MGRGLGAWGNYRGTQVKGKNFTTIGNVNKTKTIGRFGKFIVEPFVYRPNGQSTFSIKWINQSKSFMFRLERHYINSPNIGYRTHINLDRMKKGINAHIYLNPKYWKFSSWR